MEAAALRPLGGVSALLALGVRDPKIIAVLEALAVDLIRAECEQFGEEVTRLLAEELQEELPPTRTLGDLLEQARTPPPSSTGGAGDLTASPETAT